MFTHGHHSLLVDSAQMECHVIAVPFNALQFSSYFAHYCILVYSSVFAVYYDLLQCRRGCGWGSGGDLSVAVTVSIRLVSYPPNISYTHRDFQHSIGLVLVSYPPNISYTHTDLQHSIELVFRIVPT